MFLLCLAFPQIFVSFGIRSRDFGFAHGDVMAFDLGAVGKSFEGIADLHGEAAVLALSAGFFVGITALDDHIVFPNDGDASEIAIFL